jgi:hypothetical protein
LIIIFISNDDCIGAKNKYNEKGIYLTPNDDNFLKQLFVALDNNDIDLFSDACFNFDKLTKLDPIMIELLLHIKQNIILV